MKYTNTMPDVKHGRESNQSMGRASVTCALCHYGIYTRFRIHGTHAYYCTYTHRNSLCGGSQGRARCLRKHCHRSPDCQRYPGSDCQPGGWTMGRPRNLSLQSLKDCSLHRQCWYNWFPPGLYPDTVALAGPLPVVVGVSQEPPHSVQ